MGHKLNESSLPRIDRKMDSWIDSPSSCVGV